MLVGDLGMFFYHMVYEHLGFKDIWIRTHDLWIRGRTVASQQEAKEDLKL